MDNIKVDHLAKTVYDNKEEIESKFKKQERVAEKSFLNDIKQQDIKESNEKNLLIKMNFQNNHSKINSYVELKSIATNHLSYLEDVRNVQFEVPDYLLATGCLKSYEEHLDNKVEKLITKDGSVENNKQYLNLIFQSNSKNDQSFSIELPIEIRGYTSIPSEVFKKNILITKSELFVRDFHGDCHNLLENIKRQLPDSIDRIWLNGRMVWSKI